MGGGGVGDDDTLGVCDCKVDTGCILYTTLGTVQNSVHHTLHYAGVHRVQGHTACGEQQVQGGKFPA